MKPFTKQCKKIRKASMRIEDIGNLMFTTLKVFSARMYETLVENYYLLEDGNNEAFEI